LDAAPVPGALTDNPQYWRGAATWQERLHRMDLVLLDFVDPDFWVTIDEEVRYQVDLLWTAYRDLHEHMQHLDQCERVRLHRQRARQQVHQAVKDGNLVKPAFCEHPHCPNPAEEAHHLDYRDPLNVIWMCVKHHRERHRKDGL